MLKQEEKQMSFYSTLYEKIPETHLLKRIERAVDFCFINELKTGGRFLVLLIIPLVLLQLYITSYRISTFILKKETAHETVRGG